MDKTTLPDGITFNGKERYYNDKETNRSAVDDPFITIHESNEIQQLRRQEVSIPKATPKNKAFKKERPPGKIQRVTETIIYDEERIKLMSKEKYHKEFKQYIQEHSATGPLATIAAINFGTVSGWKNVRELNENLAKLMKDPKTGKFLLNNSTLSHHLSAYWKDNRLIRVFVRRRIEKSFIYEATDMMLRLGPEIIARYRTVTVPKTYEQLRLSLSAMRQAAKARGISEDAFNEFLRIRFDEIVQELVPNRKPQRPFKKTKTIDKPKIKMKYPSDLTKLAEKPVTSDNIELKEMPLAPEPVKVPEVPEPVKVQEKEVVKVEEPRKTKITVDMKIWFVPVVGTLTIE